MTGPYFDKYDRKWDRHPDIAGRQMALEHFNLECRVSSAEQLFRIGID